MLAAAAPVLAQAQEYGDNEAFKTLGSGQWLQVRDTPDLALPSFTIECWTRVLGSGLLLTRDVSTGEPSDWQLWYENQRVAFITAKSPPDSYFYTPTGSIMPGRWYHLALVVNGPAGYAELYIDGELSIRPTFSPRSFDASTGLAVGGYYNSPSGSYLVGEIDEVRYWRRNLNEAEIRRNMNHRLPLDERDGLVGYWSFCGNFADSSGYGHDLEATGVTAPEVVTGLPEALACDILPPVTPALEWTGPVFPRRPCLDDSVFTADVVLHNTTSELYTLQELYLTGSNADEFTLVNNPAPRLLQAHDSLHITMVFRPTDTGLRSAILNIVGKDSTTLVPIQARYDGPFVEIDALPMTFRSVDGLPDTQRLHLINHSSTQNAVLLEVRMTPSDNLTLLTPVPMNIPPSSTRDVEIQFNPEGTGTVSADIQLIIDNCETAGEITAYACPELQTATLDIPPVTGTPGDTVWIPLRIRQWDSFLLVENTVVYGQLQIDCHALYPLFGDGGTWDAPTRTISLQAELSGQSDTVAMLPFLFLLGTDTTCALTWRVDSIQSSCPFALTGTASNAAVTGLCQDGGTRLFDGSRFLSLEAPHPSPGNGSMQVRFHTIEEGRTSLIIYDAAGRIIRTVLHEPLSPGVHVHNFNVNEFNSGVYFLLLKTPSQLRTRRFIVVK
ncbi:choice-of-anchor D domain-containing protein [bacterium]|nr:choice-of-anchor D domain-containing protein [bacterium]